MLITGNLKISNYRSEERITITESVNVKDVITYRLKVEKYRTK